MALSRTCFVVTFASIASIALGCSSGTSLPLGCSSTPPPSSHPDGGTDSGSGTEAGTDANQPPPNGPTLSALTVTSPSNASVILTPSFSPGVYNYYVPCGSGSNALKVSFTAGPGNLGALVTAPQGSLANSPASSAWTASQTTMLNVEENAAVVAFATNSSKSTTTQYWVRCLPDDFPPIQMTLHPSAGTPQDGYYLVGDRQLVTSTLGGYAMVIDIRGVPVWYLRMPTGEGVINVDDVYPGAITLLESNLTQYEVHVLDPLKTFIAAPPNSTITASMPFPPNLEDQHELRYLPNGDFMVIANPDVAVDMSGVTATDGTVLGPNTYIRACNVIEFNPKQGNAIVWQWTGSDHIDTQKESTVPIVSGGYVSPSGGYMGIVVDALHCNSIDMDPNSEGGNGNFLMSARNMDAVWYVEKSTGKILWKLGGAKYSMDNAALVTASDPFYEQHDARIGQWDASCNGGTGQISVFDDESDYDNPARGVIYDVVVGGGSTSSCADGGKPSCASPGTAVVAWQYKGAAPVQGTGSFRFTDLGRVIGWGFGGTANLAFTEVDESGNDLLDFYFNDDSSSYRTVKVPLTAFPIDVLRQTAGGNETVFP
jgi:Arylsulfotransferase (ASST)